MAATSAFTAAKPVVVAAHPTTQSLWGQTRPHSRQTSLGPTRAPLSLLRLTRPPSPSGGDQCRHSRQTSVGATKGSNHRAHVVVAAHPTMQSLWGRPVPSQPPNLSWAHREVKPQGHRRCCGSPDHAVLVGANKAPQPPNLSGAHREVKPQGHRRCCGSPDHAVLVGTTSALTAAKLQWGPP